MKKIKNISKNLLIFILGGIILGSIGIYAATQIASSNVTYTNNGQSTVQGALNDLFSKIKNPICKRATELHSDGTHTFGQLGTTGILTSGDAFDCDVDGTGYNHRFYFVSYKYIGGTEGYEAYDTNIATLIYYSNVSGGVANNTTKYAYNSENKNYDGPVTAVKELPTITQWSRLKNTKRVIVNEKGGNYNTVSSTNYELSGNGKDAYDYSSYAARLLTYQEVVSGCGSGMPTSTGYLDSCKYLMENTKYSNAISVGGYWLETTCYNSSNFVWYVSGNRDLYVDGAYIGFSVRPAIDVSITDIKY